MSKPQRLCYFCGQPATTREHVPPKILFQGHQSHGIVVPSCSKCNNEKSQSDSTLVIGWLKTVELGKDHYIADPEVLNVMSAVQPNFGQAKRLLTTAKILSQLDYPLVQLSGKINIRLWICQITAGLVYKRLGRFEPKINWEEAKSYSPYLFETSPTTLMPENEFFKKLSNGSQFRSVADNIPWLRGWLYEAYPEKLYRFDICFKDDLSTVMFRHTFYNVFIWYVFVDVPSDIGWKLRYK
jgi:hypothetical protein